jgi:hypothetical protein
MPGFSFGPFTASLEAMKKAMEEERKKMEALFVRPKVPGGTKGTGGTGGTGGKKVSFNC